MSSCCDGSNRVGCHALESGGALKDIPDTHPRAGVASGPSMLERRDEDNMMTANLKIKGMDCPGCAEKIERVLTGLSGVESCSINFVGGTLTVRYIPSMISMPEICARVRKLGYTCFDETVNSPGDDGSSSVGKEVGLVVVAGILLAAGMWSGESWCYAAAAVSAGISPAVKAGGALLSRTLDINVLMLIAVAGAFVIGDRAEGATVVFLFSLGELLEGFAVQRSHAALERLLAEQPDRVRLQRAGEFVLVPVDEVEVGDVFEIRPGDTIPLDAVVMEGESSVDESSITGESVPVEKLPGQVVYGGTVNKFGRLLCQVLHRRNEGTLARVVKLVDEAQSKKGRRQRLVDRAAAYYTPGVILLSVATVIIGPQLTGESVWPWLYRALVLLVIACPCALVISTPVSIVSALTGAAAKGLLVKGGDVMEVLADSKVIALDKTGTLTKGKLKVERVVPSKNISQEELLRLAAAVEQGSEHPVARAIVTAYEELDMGEDLPPVSAFEATVGSSATGMVGGRLLTVGKPDITYEGDSVEQNLLIASEAGLTVVELREGDVRLGLLGLSDEIRDDSVAVCRRLHEYGLKVVLVTGDKKGPADRIARMVGVDEVYCDMLPQDKLRVIQDLRKEYGCVVMVGDGINDAPALSEADVGIAMGAAGNNVALETADVALLGNDLTGLVRAVDLSRRTVGIIRWNITFSIVIKAVFLVLALGGMAGMWMAIAADMGASLLVIANGLRLAH